MPTKSGRIPTCYASCSIGYKPEHNLEAKLKVISGAGFDAIELSMPDLLSFASDHLGKEVGPKDFEDLCEAGEHVKKLCQEHKLKILILQPFSNFEGWSKGTRERDDAFERARGWMRIMESVGTDMLQVSDVIPALILECWQKSSLWRLDHILNFCRSAHLIRQASHRHLTSLQAICES